MPQAYEESPGSTGQECKLTACEGDFRESATERYRPFIRVRVKRRGKSSPVPVVTRERCKPHSEQRLIQRLSRPDISEYGGLRQAVTFVPDR